MSLRRAQLWQILKRQRGTSITGSLCSGAREPQNVILTATGTYVVGWRYLYALQMNSHYLRVFLFFVLCNAHSKKFRQLPFPIQYLVRSYWSRLKAIEQYLLWCGTWSNFPWLSLIFLEVFTNSSGSDFSTVGGIILFVWVGKPAAFLAARYSIPCQ